MNLHKTIEALAIFARYRTESEPDWDEARSGYLCIRLPNKPISNGDQERLLRLGWCLDKTKEPAYWILML